MHTCGSIKHTWVSKDGLQAMNAVPDALQRIELDKSGRTLRARGLATARQTGSQLVTVLFVFTRSSIDVHDYLSMGGMLLYIAYSKGSATAQSALWLASSHLEDTPEGPFMRESVLSREASETA